MTTAEALPVPTRHTLRISVPDASDWAVVERRAVEVTRLYFRIPKRGHGAEGDDDVLAGAEIEVRPSPTHANSFDATVVVSR